MKALIPLFYLIGATVLEVSGDAIVRIGILQHAGLLRVGIMLAGGVLLLGYGSFLNLAPLEFEQVVGLYIATLFVVWQIIGYAFFRHIPSAPILIGGVLIVVGGLIVTYGGAKHPIETAAAEEPAVPKE